ncbi:hypothetical protein D3C72_789100 [compost metagenome]
MPPIERVVIRTSSSSDSSLTRAAWAVSAPVESVPTTLALAISTFSFSICSTRPLTRSTAVRRRPSASSRVLCISLATRAASSNMAWVFQIASWRSGPEVAFSAEVEKAEKILSIWAKKPLSAPGSPNCDWI